MNISSLGRRVLLLSALPGFGLKSFHSLLQQLEGPEALQYLSPAQLDALELPEKLKSGLKLAVSGMLQGHGALLEQVECWLKQSQGRHVIGLGDVCYPELLKEVYQPPPLLYAEGNLELLGEPSLAMVGSRKAGMQGLRHARSFASELAAAGYVVVSGLAVGVDAAAHRGALDQGGGTIAVLGTGLDRVYPRQNQALAKQILERDGLLLSEMKLGTPPIPSNFPRRNRLVSGLSSGVMVVEAGLKSGSLITARFAAEQGREVFAIPGSIENPEAKGCHALIKDGATLVESLDDVLVQLSSPVAKLVLSGCTSTPASKVPLALDEKEARLAALLSYDHSSFDELKEASSLDAAELSQTLLMLEIKQVVAAVPGGYQRVK